VTVSIGGPSDLTMPLVRIETRRWVTHENKQKLLVAIHRDLIKSFNVPEDDRSQRIIEYAAEDLEIRPGAQ
jgi:hypothetical protein